MAKPSVGGSTRNSLLNGSKMSKVKDQDPEVYS